jgi:hypothetical protein
MSTFDAGIGQIRGELNSYILGNITLAVQRYEVKTVTEATINLIETVDLLGLNKQVSHKFEHGLQKVIDALAKDKLDKAN